MLDVFIVGALAGYAIAIPIGPIALLILRTGMRDGLPPALAAGAGAATADLVYSSLAMLAGPALVALIAPALKPVRLVAAGLLLAFAIRGLVTRRETASGGPAVRSPRIYLTVLALTLLNPSTVVYFASLTVGLPAISSEPGARALFILGAVLASLSWQSLLAVVGASLHGRMPGRLATATGVLSAVIIGGLAVKIASDALGA